MGRRVDKRLHEFVWNGEFLAEFADIFSDALEDFPIVFVLERLYHKFRNVTTFLLLEFSRRDGGCAKTNTRWVHRLTRVISN